MASKGIGLIGCGVVGQGVVDILRARREALTAVAGPHELVAVAVRDPKKARAGVAPGLLTTPEALVRDARVDLVVEVAGGVEGPFSWVREALERGKAVVTANKALLAERAEVLFPLFSAPGARLYCEAAVAGGIPVIHALDRGLVANRVLRLEGILNGTCNYLLTRMEKENLSFDAALKLAQEKGFAEADPTLDVSGGDAAHKLAVLAMLALGRPVPFSRVFVEGIQRLTAFDLAWAASNGMRIKLLATGRFNGGQVELRVHPTLVSKTRLLSQVMEELNAVELEGDLTGPQLYEGRGAGQRPTASAVVSDIVQALRGEPMLLGPARAPSGTEARFLPMDEVVSRHYLHLEVIDRPGVVAKLTATLADHAISIASMFQPDVAHGSQVPLVITTHPAKEEKMRQALAKMAAESFVQKPPVHIRMEAGA
jgi:homoserine dehydrogenase